MPQAEHTLRMEEHLQPYWQLCTLLLQTPLVHLSRSLVPSDTLDRAFVPAAISAGYDEVLFSGILFETKEAVMCRIQTAFNICFTALALGHRDGFMVIGPYLADEALPARMEDLLAKNGISLEKCAEYTHYFNSLAVLSTEKIYAVCNALFCGLYGQPLAREAPVYLEVTPDFPSPCPVLEEDSLQVQADAIAKRYAIEQDIMRCIARGEFEAIDSMMVSGMHLNRFANKLRNDKNQSIILNTLARKSLETACVHPFYIDSISAKWAMRIENAENVETVCKLRRDMLYDYCRMAHTHSLASYSPNVRAMLNYVQFNLGEKITLEAIADRLSANASYLSQQFNREVGKSLPEYIAEKRVAEAKRLLHSQEELSISQIATSLGFADVNYFAKTFKKYTGIPPTRYRSKIKES